MTQAYNSWKHCEEKVFCCHHAGHSMCFLYHFPSYSWAIIAKLFSHHGPIKLFITMATGLWLKSLNHLPFLCRSQLKAHL